jgi:hypothetical protein
MSMGVVDEAETEMIEEIAAADHDPDLHVSSH